MVQDGSGSLGDDAHPVLKVNEMMAVYAAGKLFVTIGKGSSALKKEIKKTRRF